MARKIVWNTEAGLASLSGDMIPINKGMGYARADGPQQNVPVMKGNFANPPVIAKTGSGRSLTEANNTLATAVLVANTASTDSVVWEFTVENNRQLHFRPQNVDYGDRNITSLLLLLKDSSTTPAFIGGTYKILVWNANKSGVKVMLASGSLVEFGSGTTLEASLTDYNKRVYYQYDAMLDEGNVMQLIINSATVMVPANSSIVLECVEYVS
jgi:hypothetical protein